MIRPMAMESIFTLMELNTKDTGKRTSNMERVKKPGLMELAMKVIMLKARKMASVDSNGLMDPLMKASS